MEKNPDLLASIVLKKYSESKEYGTITETGDNKKENSNGRPKGWGARHTFSLLSFLSLMINWSLRANISVAIVAMVSSGNVNNDTDNVGTECPFPETVQVDSIAKVNTGEFDWTPEEQGFVLGSFYYGFIVTQIPGGILTEKFGGKWMMGLMTFFAGLLTMFNPLAAREGGTVALATLRIIQGLVQGLLVPCTFSMVSKWIPKNERSHLFNLIWSGFPVGTVLTMPLSGVIADSFGWEYVYYFFGVIAMAFAIIWIVLAHNSPKDHQRMNQVEQNYILRNLQTSDSSEKKLPLPPWKDILTSVPLWSLTIAFTGSCFGYYMMLTEIPTYLSTIQHFSLTTNGFLSALPYLLMIISSIPSAWLADYLISNEITSRGRVRKAFTIIGLIGPSIFFVVLAFTKCNPTLAVVWLCVAVMLYGANNAGMNINQMELSPNYAGTLRGFTNTFGNMTGFVAPLFAGSITNQNQTLGAWKTIFLATAAIQTVTTLMFITFGKTSVQPWNTYWENPSNIKKTNKEFQSKI